MNKILLSALTFFLAATSLSAQLPGTQLWSKIVAPVTDAKEIYRNAPIAVGADGSVFSTGSFDQGFTFGDTELENIATSAYLAKRDAMGKELWAVALKGAATITAIDVDVTDNVYVAGIFADKVIVGSTDNKASTITAKADGKAKSSAFVAHYDAEGQLKAVRSFYTTPLEGQEGYFPEPGDVYFRPSRLQVANGKIYLAASFTGTLALDNVKWEGRLSGIPFVFAADMASGGILTLNAADLTGAQSVALMQVKDIMAENDSPVEDINFVVDGDIVYAAFVSSGTQQLTTSTYDETLSLTVNGEKREHPFILAAIGQTTLVKVFHTEAHDALYRTDRVKTMAVAGDKLYLGGTFYQQLGFAPAISSEGGAADCFVACLNKSNFAVQWAQNSKNDEGDAKKQREVFTGMLIEKDKVFVTGYVENTADRSVASALAFDLSATASTPVKMEELVSASAQKGTVYAVAKIKDTQTTTAVYDVKDLVAPSLSVERITTTDRPSATFDLSGRRVQKATQGLYIVDGQKVIF